MPIVYIHVGLPKSASTSIQASLAKARPILRKNGMAYPGDDIDHAHLIARFHPAGTDHFRFVHRGTSPSQAEALCAKLIEDIQATAQQSPAPDMIISTEYIYRLPKNMIRQMRRFFRELGYKAKIVCYVRHPLLLAQSSLQQNVKSGITDIKSWKANPNWPSSRDSLEHYLAVYGRDLVIVRDLHAAMADGPVRDLLRVAKYKGPLDEIENLRRNESLSSRAVHAISLVNKLPLSRKMRQRLVSPLMRMKGPKFTLSPEICDQVDEAVQAELAWLQSETGLVPHR